ncbi:hypothetical protein LWI29_006580 [Acer saccharum]|uniref:Myb-like domain-containing protein n=1 Tax=Acer saccharum TaxID=4024 RepID=A0AA39RQC5_ACESA|nr:hypothetical protein LWI29_006580 [Acer saccharum]KAK1557649.1 hypothetical protein Q3G72_028755 [Acer saccharum]
MGDSSNYRSGSVSDQKRLQVSDNNNNSKVVEFSEDEEMLVARMFNLVGERWGLIAGRIPGRTAEEVEKYWTSKYSSSTSRRGGRS